MRMSQDLARQIANKLVEKKRAGVEKLKKAFDIAVTKAYIEQTPKAVLKAFKLHREYFKAGSTSTITLNGHGFNWDYADAVEKVIDNGNGRATLKLDSELAKKLKELQTAWQNEKERVEGIYSEIKTALIGLKTFTQIQKHLPEAVPYLPKSSSVELMINLDDLRTKIKAA